MDKIKKDNLVLLSRRRTNVRNSIEEVFISLVPFLHLSKITEVPYCNAGMADVVKNMIFAYRNRGKVTHIIGDVHYLGCCIGRRSILTIHDIGSVFRGNYFSRFFKLLFWFWLPGIFIGRITVISEFTRQELIKKAPFLKKKVLVVHNPYNQRVTYKKKVFNASCPVILHVGTKENKNLIRVIKALKGINCHLVIVGPLTQPQIETLKSNNVGYTNRFGLSFEDIVSLYEECDIVSFPSLYEGFGMPILEGNKAGRVIITSKICSMPEVAGNSAHFVDPYNVEDIRVAFLKIISNSEYREELITRGFENLKRFSPDIIANKYENIYKGFDT